MIMIFVYLLISELVWIFLYVFRKTKNIKGNLTSTLVIITETYNSGILIQIVNSVVCEKINQSFFLSKDLAINCDTEEFVKLVNKNKKLIFVNLN